MSEQLGQEGQTPENPGANEVTPIVAKALEQGWRPKEEFEGDASEFIDAPEFVRRGELFSKIEHQSKELKAVRQALEAFKQHHGKVKEAEYERALQSLKAARKEAVVNGEHEQAFALEEKIDEIKAEKDDIVREAATPVAQSNQEFTDWMAQNKWYTLDAELRSEADALGVGYHAQGKSPSEVLGLVEKRIKKMFPEKFSNPKADAPSKVGTPTRGAATGGRETFQMSDSERQIMRKIVSTGVMTEAQYIADLKKL